MALPSSVVIREVGPREGFQTVTSVIPTAEKLELIRLLNATGVREIELTSFVRTDRVPQMADAEQVVARFERQPGVRYSALYLNQKGFERAEASGALDNRAWIMTATSDTFLLHNNNTSQQAILDQVPMWIEAFTRWQKNSIAVMVSTAFGCSYEGKFEPEKTVGIVAQLIERIREETALSIDEISIADTVGWGSPEQVRRLIGLLVSRYPQIPVSLHLHDTRGSGLANAYAGLLEGVSIFDASVGGMGGCPFARGAAGNIVTEDFVSLCEESGIRTGINIERYCEAALYAEKILAHPLASKALRLYQAGLLT